MCIERRPIRYVLSTTYATATQPHPTPIPRHPIPHTPLHSRRAKKEDMCLTQAEELKCQKKVDKVTRFDLGQSKGSKRKKSGRFSDSTWSLGCLRKGILRPSAQKAWQVTQTCGELGTREFFGPRLPTSMTGATVEDSGWSGPNPPYETTCGWWVILPWRLGVVHEFIGTWAARRNSGSGREKASDAGLSLLLCRSDKLPVIHTPWVAISVVSMVAPPSSTALRVQASGNYWKVVPSPTFWVKLCKASV